MKKAILSIILATVLVGCSDRPQPQVVQVPTQTGQAPVVIQQPNNNTGELIGAGALGFMAGRMTANSAPTQAPTTIIERKTVYVNQAPTVAPVAQTPVKTIQPTPAPAPSVAYKPSTNPFTHCQI